MQENGHIVKKTLCDICNPHTHCGIDAHVSDGVIVKIEGSRDHPKNRGSLCAKGSASRQYVYNQDRLLAPMMRTGERGSGQFKEVSWEDAFEIIADRLNKIKATSGPESVVFYAGYSKWFRPFLKRLAHSFGSPNYATESSTCSTAARLAGMLTFGAFGEPDLSDTGCLLVWSTNPFFSATPSVRSLLEARQRGMKIIEVGPMLTPLSVHADVHLRLRPGTTDALALSMAHVIIDEKGYDTAFVDRWTTGFDAYAEYVRSFPPERAETITGVPAGLIRKAARLMAAHGPAALKTSACTTVHHTNGVQNQRALLALVALTGSFDRPGGNRVQAPSWISVPAGVKTRQRQWEQSRPWSEMPPRIGQDRFPVWSRFFPEAQAMHIPVQIESRTPYPVRSILGFGMRYQMWPGSDVMLERLRKLDFFVNVDIFMTDTGRQADILLPACTSFERSELKFYAERYAMWTQPVIAPLGQSRSDADIIFALAGRIAADDVLMGNGYEAAIDWILEPSGLDLATLKRHPDGISIHPDALGSDPKYLTDGFPTPSKKMEFVSSILETAGFDGLPKYIEPVLSPVSTPQVADRYPLILNTGSRLPMYQHSRTFRLSWTRQLRPDPSVDINPVDAKARNLSTGDRVVLATPRNRVTVKANVTEVVPPGVVSIYHAWPEIELNSLIDPDYLDPISGFPGFKSMLCEINKTTD
jgi:anaerobic selenocysteine-containing dehydrogenase